MEKSRNPPITSTPETLSCLTKRKFTKTWYVEVQNRSFATSPYNPLTRPSWDRRWDCSKNPTSTRLLRFGSYTRKRKLLLGENRERLYSRQGNKVATATIKAQYLIECKKKNNWEIPLSAYWIVGPWRKQKLIVERLEHESKGRQKRMCWKGTEKSAVPTNNQILEQDTARSGHGYLEIDLSQDGRDQDKLVDGTWRQVFTSTTEGLGAHHRHVLCR